MHVSETTPTPTSAIPVQEPVLAAIDYARALRAIGQDLSELFPKVLIIDTDGRNFEVRGESHANPFHQIREPGLKRLWNKLFGKKAKIEATASDSAGATFTRAYTAADIDRLDQLYSANRSGLKKRPDNYSLAERLRTLGGIVNSRKGRLKQLRKNADQFFVDYWDQDDKLRTAKLTTVILYRNQQVIDPQKNPPAPKELWEGYDF
jgi:hypothetical protein